MKQITTMKVTNSRCKCSGCGEYFNSVGAFDKHRKGDFKDEGKNRHCDTSGMAKNADGYWVTALRESADFDRTQRPIRRL